MFHHPLAFEDKNKTIYHNENVKKRVKTCQEVGQSPKLVVQSIQDYDCITESETAVIKKQSGKCT